MHHRLATALRSRDRPFIRPQALPVFPLLAPMAQSVLFGKALLLLLRTVDLGPLPVLEDDLIAAGEDLEWLADLLSNVNRTILMNCLFDVSSERRRQLRVSSDVAFASALGDN